jgi:hypothetical protein
MHRDELDFYIAYSQFGVAGAESHSGTTEDAAAGARRDFFASRVGFEKVIAGGKLSPKMMSTARLIVRTIAANENPPSSTDAYDMPYSSGYLHRACSTAAVEAKYDYVITLYKQYSDDNAPALTESQGARIWDGQGNCGSEAGSANLSRTAMTQAAVIDYLGSVMTASIKWRQGDYKAARYFVDEFLGTESMINRKARYMNWQNWLGIDKPIAQKMGFMNAELMRRGFPSVVPIGLQSNHQ